METIQATPKRRGRPPTTYEYINGVPFVTTEVLDKEIEKLEKHRKQCRDRYRNKTRILKTLRPDIFSHNNRNGNSRINGQIVQRFGIPINTGLLQPTQEEGDTSEVQGRPGFHEQSLREIYFGATS